MRVHNLLPRRQQRTGTVERSEPHAEACERVGAALLAVDDAHRMPDDEPGLANGLHRLAEGTARRDDVLDETHDVAGLVGALEAVCGAVSLGFTADDDERQPGRHRCRSGQRDRPECGTAEADGLRLRVGDDGRESLAELNRRVAQYRLEGMSKKVATIRAAQEMRANPRKDWLRSARDP